MAVLDKQKTPAIRLGKLGNICLLLINEGNIARIHYDQHTIETKVAG